MKPDNWFTRYQALITMVAGGIVYLIFGSYQVGVFQMRMTAVEKSVDALSIEVHDMHRMTAVEKSVDALTIEVHDMQKHVEWKKDGHP